jgi:hypothetical protein
VRMIFRPLHQHAYGAGNPQRGGPVHSQVIVHKPEPGRPSAGCTPVTSGSHPAWAADGAPYYNSGYSYPVYGPLITGGTPSLLMVRPTSGPDASGTYQPGTQIDLTDMTTWDRPVIFPDAR